ncbi:DEKNAAC102379 [Brettanomyces naardenensis]|uniref:DEKNAAC102379 n=1 Tax=Brettanomyces naardenensis TaxID=13370 RepID=A0A448YLK9_BRENA|nr:DEKNAAC102379 [Brettanomyces naardenensis]
MSTQHTYICQRCKLPLTIDQSLQILSNAQKHLLTTTYSPRPNSTLSSVSSPPGKQPEDMEKLTDSIVDENSLVPYHMVVPEDRKRLFQEALKANGGKPLIGRRAASGEDGSFVILDGDKKRGVVPQTEEANTIAVNENVSTLTNVFNIISSKYEIDYPVCSDCANTLIKEMNKQFDRLNKEKDSYVQFLKKLTVQSGPNLEKSRQSLEELEKLHREEEEILKQLQDAENENATLIDELSKTEIELKTLNEEEKKYCERKNRYELDLYERSNELDRVKTLYEFNMDQLDSLRKADVFNDTFDISSDGLFGTINGLRLGSLDETKVSWHEINAALGQIVLLLSVCIRILGLKIPEYNLIPMGSTSKIEKVETGPPATKTVLDLFSMGEFSIGRLYTHNKLDAGMIALVDVVRKLGEELKRIDSGNELPFIMTKDKVAGYNIKPSARGSNEEWTTACKHLLMNVKWILTFCVQIGR